MRVADKYLIVEIITLVIINTIKSENDRSYT